MMHPVLQQLREATVRTQWSGRLFVVGGAVRDELLTGNAPTDFDLMVQGDAVELARYLFAEGISSIAPVIYPRFGTAMVRIADQQVELASARAESYDPRTRKPEVRPGTLEEDAARRDFTVNALMRNLHSNEVLDPTGLGLADFDARLLRTPKDPHATFSEDPLRMLRAVRFQWQLGFEPVEGLRSAIQQEAPRLAIISAERITEELKKMLALPEGHRCLEDLQSLGLTAQFAPEFDAMVGVEQGKFHFLDVWHHTLLVVANTRPDDLILRLAALFHDIGKPATRFVDDDGNVRFFGHEEVGAKLTRVVMRRLKFSSAEVDAVTLLVRHHMRLASMPVFTPAAGRRVVRDLGEETERLLDLVEADASALRPGVRSLDLGPIRETLRRIQSAAEKTPLVSPLSGEEIQAILGVEPGRIVGEAKAFLTELVLDGDLDGTDRVGAQTRLRSWFASR
jgi:poly(A) polymerase